MSLQTVLVIDDERDIRELLTITLGRMDLQVEAVGTVADARRALGPFLSLRDPARRYLAAAVA